MKKKATLYFQIFVPICMVSIFIVYSFTCVLYNFDTNFNEFLYKFSNTQNQHDYTFMDYFATNKSMNTDTRKLIPRL